MILPFYWREEGNKNDAWTNLHFYMHALLFITKKGGALHVEHAVDPQNARITFCNTQQQQQMHNQHIHSITIVGAGTMGNGIAHVCAMAGFPVKLIYILIPFYSN